MYVGWMEKYADTFKAIGQTVDTLRKEQGLTKCALADFADLQECHIRKVISGKHNFTLLTFLKVCEALQISPLDFFKKLNNSH